MQTINFRIGDLELRSCGEYLMLANPHNTCEIIKWEKQGRKEYCYVVAYWKRDKEGFNLQFVGHRPFDIEANLFMHLAQVGQYWLDIEFKDTEES